MIVLFVHLREAQSYLYGKKRGCTNISKALLLSNQKMRRSLVTKKNKSYTLVIAVLSSKEGTKVQYREEEHRF
jgi:hypothetical protein